jgi:cytochrome b6-f complex iron-sulfur subunit
MDKMNRREQLFLLWAVSATGLVIALAVALFILALPRSSTRFTIGQAKDFPPGSVQAVNLPDNFVDPLVISITAPKVWVVRDDVGTFTVLYARSTFHGLAVNWVAEDNLFEDPVLGSRWDRDGSYREGPDPRDLDRFPVSVENGQAIIDLHLIRGASHTQ